MVQWAVCLRQCLCKGCDLILISDLLKIQPADKTCLIYNDEKISFGTLDKKSTAMAKSAYFIHAGEKIFLQEFDPVHLLLCFFAIIKAGGVCVIAHSKMPAILSARLMRKHQITKKVTFQDFINNTTRELPRLCENDIFLGAMSSGSSTGIPKIILRDHKSWAAAFPWQSKLFHITSNDTLLLAGEFSYTGNLNACIHAFYAGACVILSKNRLPQTWRKEIKKYSATAIFMVPAHYKMLLKAVKRPDCSIISLVTGGAKIDKATVKELHTVFPQAFITEYYGASELGHVSYAELSDLLDKPGSSGKLFPEVKVEIINT